MKSKYVAIALLSTALMTGVASAQTAITATADKADSSAMMHKEGQWRSSKLIGVDVYNDANEKIGDVEELIAQGALCTSTTCRWPPECVPCRPGC